MSWGPKGGGRIHREAAGRRPVLSATSLGVTRVSFRMTFRLACASLAAAAVWRPPGVRRPTPGADDKKIDPAQEHREICARFVHHAPKPGAFDVLSQVEHPY